MERVKLLNVAVDNITMDDLLKLEKGMILTLHTDMLMKLQKDRTFYEVLKAFDLITCDSHILFLASKFLKTPLKERVSGSDFFPLFCAYHKNNPEVTIFLCGGKPGVAEIAQKKVNEKIGREIVVGTYSPHFTFDEDSEEIEKMIDVINLSKATVLVVGLGPGRQEIFLARYRKRFKHVQLFLPLGGTIDYEAGVLKRPKSAFVKNGFEWLYRIIQQPKLRWRRYLVEQPPVLWLLFKQRFGLYKNPMSIVDNFSRDRDCE